MASPPHESTTLTTYLGINEEVNDGSDTNFQVNEGALYNTPMDDI